MTSQSDFYIPPEDEFTQLEQIPKASADGSLNLDCPPKRFTNDITEVVKWSKAGLTVTRLDLATSPDVDVWTVIDCVGVVVDSSGKFKRDVVIELPFRTLPKKGYRIVIVDHAKKDHVFAKGLGIFDAINLKLPARYLD